MGKPDPVKLISNKLDVIFGQFKDAYLKSFDPNIITEKVYELDEASMNLAKSYGVGRENIEAINKSLTASYSEIARLGGSLGEIAGMQISTSTSLGKNVQLSKENVVNLYETFKVTQVEVGTLVDKFKTIGFSTLQISGQMQLVVNSARELGANATAVSSMAITNFAKLNEFNFANGVKGFAEMAAQSVNLKVSMTDTLNLAEKLLNPEKAIELTSTLQRLGVAQGQLLDPFRLMNLAQNDPKELQDEIAKMTSQFVSLNKETGRFEISKQGKFVLRELSTEMGMTYDALAKMAIGTEEMNDKMGKIKFPTNAFTKEQENLIMNMAQMDTDGEYKLTIGGESLGIDKAIEKLKGDEKLMKEFFDVQKEKSMEDLAKEQLSVQKNIEAKVEDILNSTGFSFASSQSGQQMIENMNKVTNTLGKAFSGINIFGSDNKKRQETFDNMNNFIRDIMSNPSQLMDQAFMNDFKKKMDADSADGLDNEGFKEFGDILKGLKNVINFQNTAQSSVYDNLSSFFVKDAIIDMPGSEPVVIKPYEQDEVFINKQGQVGIGTDLFNEKKQKPTSNSELSISFNINFDNNPIELDEYKVTEIFKKILNNSSVSEKISKSLENVDPLMSSDGFLI